MVAEAIATLLVVLVVLVVVAEPTIGQIQVLQMVELVELIMLPDKEIQAVLVIPVTAIQVVVEAIAMQELVQLMPILLRLPVMEHLHIQVGQM